MKTIPIHIGAGGVSRHIGFNTVSANHASWGHPISLVCAFLVTLGAVSAQAATEATYKLFGREVGGYASKDDLPGIVGKDLGPRASIADWDEIKKQYGQNEASLKAFCEKLGLAPDRSAWVTLGGKRFWENQRHYFIYRADHKRPEDFMLHDQLQDNFLLLGSWFDARPVLVKIKDYNAADAAKWAKWDAILAAKNEATVSGVYTLVTVNGLKLPAKVSHEGADLEVRSGTFTITADGKCSSKMIFVPPSGREATVDTRATYGREGPKLTMQWQGAGITTGTVEGSTFTMENEGMVFVYRKSSDSTKADSEPATLATKVVPAEGKAAAARSEEQGLSLKLVKVDSEETAAEDGKGANAIDGDPGTFWHTQWQGDSPSHPHEIIIELTPPSAIKGFTYLPRQDDRVNGTIKDYEFYISADGKEFGEPVRQGTFEEGKEKKIITFEPRPCRFIKLKALSEVSGQAWTSAAEVGVVRADDKATAHGEVHDSVKGSEPSGRDQPSVTAMTWEEFVTPGPAHKALEPLAGDWNVEAPWTGIVKATTRRQWVLGGRYLQEEFTGELRQNPYQGLGLFGYDNFRKKYFCTWFHTVATSVSFSEGTMDPEGKVLTLLGRADEPVTGQRDKPTKCVIHILGPDKHIVEYYDLSRGENGKLGENVYTRKR